MLRTAINDYLFLALSYFQYMLAKSAFKGERRFGPKGVQDNSKFS